MKTAIKAHGPEFKERLGLKRLKDVNDWFDLADYDRDGMVSVQWLPRDLTKPCHRPLNCVVAANADRVNERRTDEFYSSVLVFKGLKLAIFPLHSVTTGR